MSIGLVLQLMLTSMAHAAKSPPDPYQHLYGDPAAQAAFIKMKLREYFPKHYRTMLAIASCESTGLQHWNPDGSLVKNPGSSAEGFMQVLLKLHRPEIKAMGLDMQDLDDYLKFVYWLYARPPSRFSDWTPSKHCWGPKVAKQ